MPTYYQNRNSRSKYQTFKTYQVKPKVLEEPKTVQSEQQVVTEPEPENVTTNESQSKPQNKRSKIQLYSARDRQRVRHEIVEQQFQAPATISTMDDEDTGSQAPEWEKSQSDKGEKDLHHLEDDMRESVSNVSTAMTDGKQESCCSHTSDIIENAAEVLFDLNLSTENGTINVKIYNEGDEEDYHDILDQLCLAQKFDARTSLYFKINMYQLIKDRRGQGCQRIDDALDRLLEINYKLIMFDSGLVQADQAIANYICV